MTKPSRLVGCKFRVLAYVPSTLLVVHDGAKLVMLDPTQLRHLSIASTLLFQKWATFALNREQARALSWAK